MAKHRKEVDPAVQQAAENINKRMGFTGLEFIIPLLINLIPVLWQQFQNCRHPTPTPPAPGEYVNEHFHAGNYDEFLVGRLAHEARHQARLKHWRLDPVTARKVAIATLDEIRNNQDTVSAVMGVLQ